MRRQAAVLDGAAGSCRRPALPRGHRHTTHRVEQGGGDRLPVLPRARPRPGRPDEEWVAKLAATPPESPQPTRAAVRRVGHRADRDGLAGQRRSRRAGQRHGRAGASPARRRSVAGGAGRRANDSGVELTELAVTPQQVAELVGLVAAGTRSTTSSPGRPWTAFRRWRAGRRRSCRSRGWRSWASPTRWWPPWTPRRGNPDVAEKVRGGKVQAIGAMVGAVMKTTRGKADAATVKRLPRGAAMTLRSSGPHRGQEPSPRAEAASSAYEGPSGPHSA